MPEVDEDSHELKCGQKIPAESLVVTRGGISDILSAATLELLAFAFETTPGITPFPTALCCDRVVHTRTFPISQRKF